MNDISIIDNMGESFGHSNTFFEGGYSHTWASPRELLVQLEDSDDIDADKANIKNYADELAAAMGDGWSAESPRIGDEGGLAIGVIRPLNPGE